jgi:REP element-mobilizing transposase RayT
MDRFWLLTWTMYANWLPGDARGSVTTIKDDGLIRFRPNQPDTPYCGPMPGLEESAQRHVIGQPIRLTEDQATIVLAQFQETASFRGWNLLAVAIMSNHVHLVVGVPGDPDPAELLRDFKSYASRALNKQFGKPASERWWTESGSRRKLSDESAVTAAVRYVLDQQHPLVTWGSGERGASAP